MSREAAFKSLFEMETDIRNVRRWAGVLNHLGTSESTVESEQIYVISNVLFEIGKRLDARWEEAFKAARGQP
jgi:hypothetical protein